MGSSDPNNTTTSGFLPTLSYLLGWSYFLCWAFSSYPQPIINYRRRSVTGLSLDYFTINILGHSCYTLSCLSFLYSPTIRTQYTHRWGSEVGAPTVRGNDLAFTAHALFWSCFTLTQFYWWGFERKKNQRISRGCKWLMYGSFAAVGFAAFMVWVDPARYSPAERKPGEEGKGEGEEVYQGGWEELDVVYMLGNIKLLISVLKYYPQARLNYLNKSTVGWSIHKCAMDFTGSVLSLIQLGIDASLTPGGLSSVIGNPLKFWLGWVSVGFDVVFGWQHWVLYPEGKGKGKMRVRKKEDGEDEEEGRVGNLREPEGEERGLLSHREDQEGRRGPGEYYGAVARDEEGEMGSGVIVGGRVK